MIIEDASDGRSSRKCLGSHGGGERLGRAAASETHSQSRVAWYAADGIGGIGGIGGVGGVGGDGGDPGSVHMIENGLTLLALGYCKSSNFVPEQVPNLTWN